MGIFREKKKQEREYITQIAEMKIADGAYDKSTILDGNQIYIGYKKIFSDTTEKQVFVVTEIKPTLTQQEFYNLKADVESAGVYLNIQNFILPFKIDHNSAKYKESRSRAKNQKESLKTAKIDEFSTNEDLNNINKIQRSAKTFDCYRSIEARKQQLAHVTTFFELCKWGNTEEINYKYRDIKNNFKKICLSHGFLVKEIKYKLYDYVRRKTPFSGSFNIFQDFDVRNVLSDEIIARLSGFYSGQIGNSGVPIGMDITTGLMVYHDFVNNTGGAESTLIAGESGSGKSYIQKGVNILLQADNIDVIVYDIDNEYELETHKQDGIIINFNNKYCNTMVVPQPTGDPSVDKFLLIESKQVTAKVFGCCCDIEKGLSPEELAIFTEAYMDLQYEYGVDNNIQSTWIATKDFSYHKLYEKIKDLDDEDTCASRHLNQSTVKNMIQKLSAYFNPKGMYSYMFEYEVSSNEVLSKHKNHAIMIDLQLGLKDLATSGAELVVQTIKQLTAFYFSNMILYRNYSLGLHTVEVIDEYQRYVRQKFVEESILTKSTGMRKKNGNLVLATNSPLALLKDASAASYAVIENTNNFIVGALKEQSIEAVCEAFNMSTCTKLIRTISGSTRYKNCFVTKFQNKDIAVIKSMIPKRERESSIFKTRDTEKRNSRDVETLNWVDYKEEIKQKKLEGRAYLKEFKTTETQIQ